MSTSRAAAAPADYFRITIIDQETSRGVPLVELRTKNALRFWTDSHGTAAISDPGLMNQKVFFAIQSHGYRFERTFFDETGAVLDVIPGGSAVLPIRRLNIAERLYRVTGEGIYRDSVLTGQLIPLRNPLLSGGVVGQDTVIATPYRGKIYWCWGDTNGLVSFNLSASGATSELPGRGGLDPSVGVNLTYFVNESGFSKPMCPFRVPGLKWIEGLTTVKDETGRERLVARYASMRGLGYANEWGLGVFDDEKQEFERVIGWDIHTPHRSAHPFHAQVDEREMIYLFPFLRVQADLAHLKDLKTYEAFTCLVPGARFERENLPELERGPDGTLVYAWKADTDPVDEYRQQQLITAGKMKPEEAWFGLTDILSGKPVNARCGSVCWNLYRRQWVMIVEESPGQIWYAEADTPLGPWAYARKVVSHTRYCLYNPTQHPFFDQEGGRIIYFEGTYSDTFSGSPEKTPRYDYNQLMYRLTLSDLRLFLPVPVYRVEEQTGTSRYLMREAIEAQGLWDKVREVPFLALPPDRARKDTIPLFFGSTAAGTTLRAGASTDTITGNLLCHAMPLTELGSEPKDEISGVWQCRASLPDGGEFKFPLELKLLGNKVSSPTRLGGENPLEGMFEKQDLRLTIPTEDAVYEVRAHAERGTLKGEWRRSDGAEHGDFEAEMEPGEENAGPSMAEVPLYIYTNKQSGSVRYSTDPEWKSAGFDRQAEPLCRVWRNPRTVLVLDSKAKPVPAPGR